MAQDLPLPISQFKSRIIRAKLALSLLLATGCGGAGATAHIGSSDHLASHSHVELSPEEVEGTDEPEPKAPPPAVSDQANAPSAIDEETEEAVEEPREANLARGALEESQSDENHLGLAFAILERTSDLHWILAIENRSPQPVELAALPELFQFVVTPPAPDGETTLTDKNSKKEVFCGNTDFPTSLEPNDKILLEPGQLMYHAFDPRPFCKDDDVLVRGARVKASYGFPIKMKKLWRSGKFIEEVDKQKAPFVAGRTAEWDKEFVPMKILHAEEFALGRTYPLSEITPFAKGHERSGGTSQDDSQDKAPRPPPLTLVIAPLGTMSTPENTEITTSIINTSGKPMKLFVRRELITYEVAGPTGSFTCEMHPSDRHPLASEFISLGNGASTTLVTRLAEACPSAVWNEPGNYAFSARIEAEVTGGEQSVDAFLGTGFTLKPAHLRLPRGIENSKTPGMAIAPSRASH
jgi:hypothetical protein